MPAAPTAPHKGVPRIAAHTHGRWAAQRSPALPEVRACECATAKRHAVLLHYGVLLRSPSSYSACRHAHECQLCNAVLLTPARLQEHTPRSQRLPPSRRRGALCDFTLPLPQQWQRAVGHGNLPATQLHIMVLHQVQVCR